MDQWSLEWSECNTAQCWVELWFLWCSVGIMCQSKSNYGRKGTPFESEVGFEEWENWEGEEDPRVRNSHI